jgi:hypothetical protein
MKPLFIHIASPEQLAEKGFIGANSRSGASSEVQKAVLFFPFINRPLRHKTAGTTDVPT